MAERGGRPGTTSGGSPEEPVQRPARDAPEPPHYQVQRALAHDPRVGELELQVTIRAGKVMVAGSVPTEDVRNSVTVVVREALPDAEVHNHTTVAVFPEPEEVERL